MRSMADEPREKPERKKYPSRQGVKYLLVKTDLFEALKDWAEDEGRLLSFLANRAVKELLERNNRPLKGRPRKSPEE